MDYKPESSQLRFDCIGSYDAYRELEDLSSVDLLRNLIIRSIRKREVESQGFLEQTYDGSENGRRKHYSHTNVKHSIVKIEPYNRPGEEAESDISDLELSTSVEEDRSRTQQKSFDKTKRDETDSYLSENSLESNKDVLETEEKFQDVELASYNAQMKTKEEFAPNGLKLARRTFSGSIYEDCSTYNISSDKVNFRKQCNIGAQTDEISIKEKVENPTVFDTSNEKNEIEQIPEDQTVVCNPFFNQVTSDSLPIEESLETDISVSTDNDFNVCEVDSNASIECNSTGSASPKRKHSRRHRKRSRKRNKSKKSFVYECSKCGVSYVIPTKKMNDVACCLHCDLWTPVEPVFIGRERTAWNNCRIC